MIRMGMRMATMTCFSAITSQIKYLEITKPGSFCTTQCSTPGFLFNLCKFIPSSFTFLPQMCRFQHNAFFRTSCAYQVNAGSLSLMWNSPLFLSTDVFALSNFNGIYLLELSGAFSGDKQKWGQCVLRGGWGVTRGDLLQWGFVIQGGWGWGSEH